MVTPALTWSWNLTDLIRASCQRSRETERGWEGQGEGGSDLHPAMELSFWLLIQLEGRKKMRQRFSIRTLTAQTDTQRSISQPLTQRGRVGRGVK